MQKNKRDDRDLQADKVVMYIAFEHINLHMQNH